MENREIESLFSSEGPICAIDSGLFERGGLKKPIFKAPLGVAVTISNYQTFKELYNQTLDGLIKKHGRYRDKYVYCSSGIMSLFNNPSESDEFFEDFFKETYPAIKHLDIFYSYFPKNQPSEILIYGKGQTSVERLTPIKFIDGVLRNSYPHLCAWKYYEAHPDCIDIPVFLDHFQAEVTTAWSIVQNKPKLFVFLKGDECNMGISFADIILKIVNNKLYRKLWGLYPDKIVDILPEISGKVHPHFLGQKFLPYITPVFPKQISFETKIKHPIVFLIREPASALITRGATEASPLWKCVQNFACKIDGCAKFFDPDWDFRIMAAGDFLTYVGLEGKRVAEIYIKMGYKVNIISPEQIISEHSVKM